MMMSGKQKRQALRVRQRRRNERRQGAQQQALFLERPAHTLAVSPALLDAVPWPGAPDFIRRGYYQDKPFTCIDCGVVNVWTAARQKWWYEVANGDLASTARRCAACRARERARKRAARQQTLAGLERKRTQEMDSGKGSRAPV